MIGLFISGQLTVRKKRTPYYMGFRFFPPDYRNGPLTNFGVDHEIVFIVTTLDATKYDDPTPVSLVITSGHVGWFFSSYGLKEIDGT